MCCPGCHRFVLSSRSESTNPLIVQAVGRPSVGVHEGQREEVKLEAMQRSCSASTPRTMNRGYAVPRRLLLFSYLLIFRAKGYIFDQLLNL